MGLGDRNVEHDAKLNEKVIQVVRATVGNSVTAGVLDRYKPGYRFEVTGVQVFASAVTATASVSVFIGSTLVTTAAITPVADTVVEGTMAVAKAARIGASSGELVFKATTNGSGDMTNLAIRVRIKPIAPAVA